VRSDNNRKIPVSLLVISLAVKKIHLVMALKEEFDSTTRQKPRCCKSFRAKVTESDLTPLLLALESHFLLHSTEFPQTTTKTSRT
jgi:hypothetical protein